MATLMFRNGQRLAQRGATIYLQPKKYICVTQRLSGREYGPDDTQVNPTGLSNASHWKMERILSAALLPVVPLALITPNPVLDTVLTATVMLHTHWGFEAVISDYIHGPVLPKLMKGAALGFSTLAFAGLLYFNYTDIGIAKAIVMLFTQL